MGDLVVFETAHHVRDGVDLANIAEELIAQPLPFGGAANETRNIDKCQPRRHDRRRFRERRKSFQPLIGHCHFTDIRLNGAKWIIGSLRRRGFRQRVEEGRFADIRQADDAAFKTHDSSVTDQTGSPSGLSAKPLASMARWTLF